MHLTTFARFAEAEGQQKLTLSLCMSWSSLAKSQHARMRRMIYLRGFAKYLQLFEKGTEVPPLGLFEGRLRRSIPHIYSEQELATLLEESRNLFPKNRLRSATCKTALGLLAATGLRPSEAINLSDTDFDFEGACLFIREGKFRSERAVLLHPSVNKELQSYRKLRNRISKQPSSHFFAFDGKNSRSALRILNGALQTICKQQGWHPRGDYPRHRLYDFRHSFVVRSALAIYKKGEEIDRSVLAISTYVGHSNIADTYWYFTAIPELMEIAVQRFQRFADGGKQK
jgi:integrase